MTFITRIVLSTATAMLFFAAAGTHVQADDLTSPALEILKTRCYSCHGQKKNGSGLLDVMEVETMVDQGYIVPSDPDQSYLWQRVADGDMPPNSDGLSKAESTILKNWISSGAATARPAKRTAVTGANVINAIHADLLDSRTEDRRFYRYFSLANLHNNSSAVTDDDQDVYRAALSKMLNSLSRNPDIYLPVAVDVQKTVYRIDLRELDWNEDQWLQVLKQYPYGFNFHQSEDRRLADRNRQIDQMTETSLCWIRADWFIAKASRSPLYETLLRLPKNLDDLERSLGVDPVKNFKNNTVQRAGFTVSGVSNGHRVLERHRARDGYYWKSFDFQPIGVNRDAISHAIRSTSLRQRVQTIRF